MCIKTGAEVKTDTRYVITADRIRMSYKEYMDMVKSEKD